MLTPARFDAVMPVTAGALVDALNVGVDVVSSVICEGVTDVQTLPKLLLNVELLTVWGFASAIAAEMSYSNQFGYTFCVK